MGAVYWLGKGKTGWVLLLAIGMVWLNRPSLGQVNDTLPQPLWEERMQVWREWANFSEKELFQAYRQTRDSWLREHVPAILPLRIEEGITRLTSSYGYRIHPVSKDWKFHNGIDLSGKPGQLVYATAQGIVQKVGFDRFLGNYIVLSHAGLFTTTYGHLSQSLVQKGQFVNREDAIGKIGKTGRATGYHLHYIVKRLGKTVDADAYLFLRYGIVSSR